MLSKVESISRSRESKRAEEKEGERRELYNEGEIILASHPHDDTPSRFSRLRQYDYSHHVVAIKVSRKEKLIGRATGGRQRRRGSRASKLPAVGATLP